MRRLDVGDRLYIYTTRGCFKNPTRDRGRIIGEATVADTVRPLHDSVVFQGREFPVGCDLSIDTLGPFGEGFDPGELTGKSRCLLWN